MPADDEEFLPDDLSRLGRGFRAWLKTEDGIEWLKAQTTLLQSSLPANQNPSKMDRMIEIPISEYRELLTGGASKAQSIPQPPSGNEDDPPSPAIPTPPSPSPPVLDPPKRKKTLF